MQRQLAAVLALVVLAALAAFWFWNRGDAPPPVPVDLAPAQQEGAAGPAAATADGPGAARGERGPQRQAVAAGADALLDDPDIASALTGFRGRVVDHSKVPVADCGVRIYRGSQDSILPEGVDVFADGPTIEPRYVAGEARTAGDGTFFVGGVWPNAFFLLFAGIGTDAPVHQLITRTPSPGEVVDLGDIVLPHAGVIVGRLVDEDGEPVVGALARAVDLPGTIVGFFPAERFDPEGAVLIREASSPIKVLEMPAWVKRAFADLPIPTATTDTEGRFRLVGVVPGSNFFAATARNFLSETRPSVMVRAGQERDLGEVRMKRGEELSGRVVDTKGEPVAGAEVFAGSMIASVPFDLAQRVGATDADGRFRADGFAPGKVTVAARRGRGHAWVLAEPQPVLGDVTVTLPATLAAVATVRLADGKPAKDVRFRLLQGRAGDGAAEMTALGFVPPIDLQDRLTPIEDGRWRIENLLAGRYTLAAEAPGHAVAFTAFEVVDADVTVALDLAARREFVVVVLGPEEKPIRNAAVYAVGRGKGSFYDMPIHCGRTASDGRLVVGKILGESVRVSADHPKWGMVHGEVKWGEDLVLRMQAPGSIRGLVTENGAPPKVGELTVTIEPRRGGGPRGALEDMPMLQALALDGTFACAAVQPGEYRVSLVKALESLRSPGGIFALAQDMYLANRLPRETARVSSGATTEVRLEAGEKPIEGPTATLSGSVTVDGKLGAGYALVATAQDGPQRMQRFTSRVDARGQFDFGIVPAGPLQIGLLPPAGESMMGGGPGNQLWSTAVTLTEAEAKVLTIDIQTGSLAGTVYDPSGAPLAGATIQAEGRLREGQHSWQFTVADAQGMFRIAPISEGTWKLTVRNRGEGGGRTELAGIEVRGGVPVQGLRLQLQPTIRVKGRVDIAVFGNDKPRWMWMAFHKPPVAGSQEPWGEQTGGEGLDAGDGSFESNEFEAGTYRVRLHAGFESGSKTYDCGEIVVPPGGVDGIVLRPVLEAGR